MKPAVSHQSRLGAWTTARGLRLCSLYSGSAGNASLIEGGGTRLLIDAGGSRGSLERAMLEMGIKPGSLTGILLTHEHGDHAGAAVRVAKAHRLPVHGTLATLEHTHIPEELQMPISHQGQTTIGELTIETLGIPHDAVDPVGWGIQFAEGRITYLTDLGHVPQSLHASLRESDIVLLDANHDVEMLQTGPYPAYLKKRIMSLEGHLSNAAAARTLVRTATGRPRTVFLAHLSEQNNRPQLALATVQAALDAADITDHRLITTSQRAATPWVGSTDL